MFIKSGRKDTYKLYIIYRWPMKVGDEAKSDRTEMSINRFICGFTPIDTKKNAELRELLKLVIKNGLGMLNVKMMLTATNIV